MKSDSSFNSAATHPEVTSAKVSSPLPQRALGRLLRPLAGLSVHLLATLPLAIALTACNGSKFTSTGASASSQTVFGGGTTTGDGTTTDNGNGNGDGNTDTSGGGSSTTLPVKYLCSNKETLSNGSNVLKSSSLSLVFLTLKGVALCTETQGIRDSILNMKKINLTACAGLADGSYQLQLIDPAANGGKGSENLFSNTVKVTVASGSVTKVTSGLSGGAAEVLFNGNLRDDKSSDATTVATDKDCDNRASPLIVDMSKYHNAYVSLTAPTDGILFDILGSKAAPIAHTKKQISWIQNPDFMFVVLPDSNGQVQGIDQLFGDNTTGPDGKHSANGYEALRKFDGRSLDGKRRIGRADGIIDKNDPVFSELRLWSDKNLDGVAQPNELFTLDELGVVSIDLNYNALYSETDMYGNQTKYKSVVGLKDGSYNLIFDIWFRYF